MHASASTVTTYLSPSYLKPAAKALMPSIEWVQLEESLENAKDASLKRVIGRGSICELNLMDDGKT